MTTLPPTIVLVHGAFAEASGFGGVLRELKATGHTVTAPPNPLRRMEFDATSVADYVGAIPGPVVLLGHSNGGAVFTQASPDLDNVAALVYVAAFGSDVGEAARVCKNHSPITAVEHLLPHLLRRSRGTPRPRPLHQERTVPRNLLRRRPNRSGRRHLQHAAAAVAGRADRKHHRRRVEEHPLVVPGVRTRQRHPPDAQRFMAERTNGPAGSISGSHIAFIAQPVTVAGFIAEAAATAGR